MKRKLIDKLIEWKDKGKDSRLKPVLITGSRGGGKTYLSFDFGKSFFKDIIYINFERDSKLAALFHEKDPDGILDNISEYFQKPVSKDTTILILDEIGICDHAIQFIVQLKDRKVPVNIIATSSKPLEYIEYGQELKKCVEQLILYPFDFEEYLWATGYEWYSDIIREHYISNKKIPDIVHKELLDIFEQYLIVGGMPRAINEYINTEAFINISEQHNSILEGFYSDAENLMNENLHIKVKNIFATMDMQISKKNKKFQYKLIRKGATKNLYMDGIDFMNASNMTIKVQKIDSDQFKLYLCDVGLQLSMIKKGSIKTDQLEARKGLIENYIAQNLISGHREIYFWESNAQAKIDFIIKDCLNVMPIEVSTDNNTRSKSLSIIKNTYDIQKSIKISTNNFDLKNNIKYVPLYAVFCINENI